MPLRRLRLHCSRSESRMGVWTAYTREHAIILLPPPTLRARPVQCQCAISARARPRSVLCARAFMQSSGRRRHTPLGVRPTPPTDRGSHTYAPLPSSFQLGPRSLSDLVHIHNRHRPFLLLSSDLHKRGLHPTLYAP
ncbi:hypothetical protein C8Q77DRAFT_704464 [Trametes polyzona]|nr:hypothetical protein C8Q77DRAFT_704464 [Trametes polyzona]